MREPPYQWIAEGFLTVPESNRWKGDPCESELGKGFPCRLYVRVKIGGMELSTPLEMRVPC